VAITEQNFLGRDTGGHVTGIGLGTGLSISSGNLTISAVERLATIYFNGGGVALTTGSGTLACTTAPFAATVTEAIIMCDRSTTTTVQLFKGALSTSAVASADMTGGANLGVTAAFGADITPLSGWTISVATKDQICGQVLANNNAQWCYAELIGTRN